MTNARAIARLGAAPRRSGGGRTGVGAVGAVPRPERRRRRYRDGLPGGVLADRARRVEGGAALRPVLPGGRRLAALRDGQRRRAAADGVSGRGDRTRALAAGDQARPLGRAVQGQRSRVADPGRRRPGRRRLLRRRRARGLRARRHRALARAARAVQELLRHGRLADHRRRRRDPGLRPDERVVHDRPRSPDRPRALAPRASRHHGVVDDADGVRAWRRCRPAADRAQLDAAGRLHPRHR